LSPPCIINTNQQLPEECRIGPLKGGPGLPILVASVPLISKELNSVGDCLLAFTGNLMAFTSKAIVKRLRAPVKLRLVHLWVLQTILSTDDDRVDVCSPPCQTHL
jgi:hypothetical protein